MRLDADRYPLTAAYLARLPAGLDSYPECQARADVYQEVGSLPELRRLAGLPPSMRALIDGDARGDWVPEVAGVAVTTLARDVVHGSDEAHLQHIDEANRRLYDKPLYRMLMRVLSPQLLVMGVSKRWGSFHRGTDMTAAPSRRAGDRVESRMTLTYPAGLFPELHATGFARAVQVALALTRPRELEVKLASHAETRAELVSSWRV